MTVVETLNVALGARSYPIHFGADLSRELGAAVAAARGAGRTIAVVTDERVRAALRELFGGALAGLPIVAVPAGEPSKSLLEFSRLCEFLAAEKLDRGSLVIAVGGGVVGDLAGFAAAAYLRGIDYWQVPTTLLAMVDSAVGGKTGVNLYAGKNLVGAFHQPRAVFCATGWLASLPAREFAAGMAEVLKYGLLGEAKLFSELEGGAPLTAADPRLARVVHRCCAIKAAIVQADEHETAATGGRALLNLGHTFAHAVEAVAGYGDYLHGEAVAIGLVCAARLSERLGLLRAPDVARVERSVSQQSLPTVLRRPLAREALLEAMRRDKKVRHGKLRFVVLEAIGRAATRDEVEPAMIAEIWREAGAA